MLGSGIVSIIDSLSAVVYVSDIDTHELLYLNPTAASLFGSDWAGRRCYQVLQSGQRGRCPFCTNDRLLVDGRPGPGVVWEFQNTVTKKWFLCIDKAIPWRDGRLVRMEIAVDISDRKEADRFNEEYVDLIAHDLRNPLNAIVLRSQGMQQSLSKKGLAQEADALTPVLAATRQAETLLCDLLETTRLHAGHLDLQRETVDLRELVDQAMARIASPAQRGRIELVPTPEPVLVDADPARLDRVIDNLLENALKYSQDRPVRVVVAREGAEGVVTFIDQGVGIPASELPNLFQRHYRASTAGAVKGLGLGLYAARLIVEAHGGRIWAESEPGRGSAFHFALRTTPRP
jgi:signal transduction histidine kinase